MFVLRQQRRLYKDHYCSALNCGEIAEGGGDFTVVVISPFVVTVLVVVDSVTIGSAKAEPILMIVNAKAIISLFIMSILIMTSAYTDIYESQYSTSI